MRVSYGRGTYDVRDANAGKRRFSIDGYRYSVYVPCTVLVVPHPPETKSVSKSFYEIVPRDERSLVDSLTLSLRSEPETDNQPSDNAREPKKGTRSLKVCVLERETKSDARTRFFAVVGPSERLDRLC